jgi:hypothetical protein
MAPIDRNYCKQEIIKRLYSCIDWTESYVRDSYRGKEVDQTTYMGSRGHVK